MSDCNHGDVALRIPCSQCGAPICCGVCCDLDEKDRRIAALQAENAKLRKAVEAAPDLQRVKRAWAIYLGSGGMKWIDAWHNAEEAV